MNDHASLSFWARIVLCLVPLVAQGATGQSPAAPPPPATEVAPRVDELHAVEVVFDAETGLGHGWQDFGWAPRELDKGRPARLDFSSLAGWILGRPGFEASDSIGGLTFRLLAPGGFTDFLDVSLEAERGRFPRVRVKERHGRLLPNGWTEFLIPMAELNPQAQPFDRVVFRAVGPVGSERVGLDRIAFTLEGSKPRPLTPEGPSRDGSFAIDCALASRPISPWIYGIAWNPGHDQYDTHQWLLGAAARRWGGNPTSRYNWELGNAWNTAFDWFFTNVNYSGDPTYTYDRFLDDNRTHAMDTALTVPTIGWVAKDTRSYSFPVSEFGSQQAVAPENPDAGNGLTTDGKEIPPGPASRTSVAASPEWVGRWIRQIRERDKTRGRSVHTVILDNEPMLWNSTHRDVHPEPTSYDELLDRTLRYAAAVREADPEVLIAGPAVWGWPAYLYSAVDAKAGFFSKPDRRRHGDVPLLPWWLRKVREHEARTGVHLLDVVDVHFYPQGDGIAGSGGKTDPATAARRIRSTRGLWDPAYVDESWIGEPIQLLPRLQGWIDENAPGLGVQIGEYNFGGEAHMSGALALAEALGRYGAHGVRSAYYWAYPAKDSEAFWAFRAYRNFDGKGGRFLDHSVKTRASDRQASLFASRDAVGERLVAILLNFDPAVALRARIDVGTCGDVIQQRAFTYAGGPTGPAKADLPPAQGGAVTPHAFAYSITVLDLTLKPRSPSAVRSKP